MDFIIEYSGLVCLVGFFSFFSIAALWALNPHNKTKFDRYKNIPLEDENGRK